MWTEYISHSLSECGYFDKLSRVSIVQPTPIPPKQCCIAFHALNVVFGEEVGCTRVNQKGSSVWGRLVATLNAHVLLDANNFSVNYSTIDTSCATSLPTKGPTLAWP